MKRLLVFVILMTFVGCLVSDAQVPVPGKNVSLVRGKEIPVYFLPGNAAFKPESKPIVWYASGDGGWRGFAVTMAETMAMWGYDVFGLDSRVYLESFTGETKLTEAGISADLRVLMNWSRVERKRPVIFSGWSEGAGLALLAAAGQANHDVVSGFVGIGLSEKNLLGWRTRDSLTWITKREPNEPTFESGPHMPRVTPVPLVLISAVRDEYTSQPALRHLFDLAGEPKKLILVEADDHRFDRGEKEFFERLRESLEWIQDAKR